MADNLEYCKQDKEPGKYVSKLNNYPGYVTFPHPFMLSHVKVWWEKAIEAIKDKTALDWEYQTSTWNAAKSLLLDYGEWAIKGVSVADIKNGNVPAEVINLVTEAAGDYVPPFLPQKSRLRIRAIT